MLLAFFHACGRNRPNGLIEVKFIPPCTNDFTRATQRPERQLHGNPGRLLHVGRIQRREEGLYLPLFKRSMMHGLWGLVLIPQNVNGISLSKSTNNCLSHDATDAMPREGGL